MNCKNENSILTVFLSGKIDSSNADAVSAELDSLIASESFDNLVLDADELSYISSAGLRIILKYRKAYPDLKIVNAGTEVYEILDMTGFTEMITVEKAFRRMSVDGCPVIGKGAKGTVYRLNGDTIIKVYKNPDSLPDIKKERELARKAFVLGIPTAISYDVVKVGDSYGSVFELLDAKSFSQMIAENPENIDKYVSVSAELLKTIHSTKVKADDMPDIKETVYKWISADKPFLPEEQYNRMNELVKNVPNTLNMLHCDYHTNNIMMQNSEALLIDMDTLSHGHPIFELANIYITYVGFGEMDPSVVESFIGLPYKTSKQVWEKFLPAYLGTDNADVTADIENRVKLLSYARFMRHTVRRGGAESDEGRKTISYCAEKISELLSKVDKLEF